MSSYFGICEFKNGSQYKVGFYSTKAFAKKRMAALIKDHYRKAEITERGGVSRIVIYDVSCLVKKNEQEIELSEINKKIQGLT